MGKGAAMNADLITLRFEMRQFGKRQKAFFGKVNEELRVTRQQLPVNQRGTNSTEEHAQPKIESIPSRGQHFPEDKAFFEKVNRELCIIRQLLYYNQRMDRKAAKDDESNLSVYIR